MAPISTLCTHINMSINICLHNHWNGPYGFCENFRHNTEKVLNIHICQLQTLSKNPVNNHRRVQLASISADIFWEKYEPQRLNHWDHELGTSGPLRLVITPVDKVDGLRSTVYWDHITVSKSTPGSEATETCLLIRAEWILIEPSGRRTIPINFENYTLPWTWILQLWLQLECGRNYPVSIDSLDWLKSSFHTHRMAQDIEIIVNMMSVWNSRWRVNTAATVWEIFGSESIDKEKKHIHMYPFFSKVKLVRVYHKSIPFQSGKLTFHREFWICNPFGSRLGVCSMLRLQRTCRWFEITRQEPKRVT